MITHDVDEAILLADSILLMTNGPERAHRRDRGEHAAAQRARATTSTTIRTTTAIRNHLVDFLVHRSKLLQEGAPRTANDPADVVARLAEGEPPAPRKPLKQ